MDVSSAHFWEHENSANMQRVKYEGCNISDEINRPKDERNVYQCCDTNLNFSTATCSEDDSEYGPYKKNKVTRQDPMSHRIIEKRRRDRMNNCLADLSRLIPTEYLKKGRGRIEKTEIIEMAIKHMKYLQQERETPSEQYRMGYQECMSEAMRFMVEVEGHFPGEGICVRILNHLQKHCESISRMPHPPQPPLNTPHSHLERRLSPHRQEVTITSTKNNNNTAHQNNIPTHNGVTTNGDHHGEYNGNGISYKYKTNIKMRFSQDLSEGVKRQKMENGRRASINSVENQSSSRSSPPSSDLLARISEQEPCRVSPTESTSSLNQLKLEPMSRSYSPPKPLIIDTKSNFNVPIFALHAKGAYYMPLTIDYKTLAPFLRSYDALETSNNALHNVVLHPVTINVNFQAALGAKFNNNNSIDNSSSSFKSEFNNNWN